MVALVRSSLKTLKVAATEVMLTIKVAVVKAPVLVIVIADDSF